MARTLLNNAQLQQLLTADKVHARSIDIEGASPLTGSLVGGDMFIVQGAGEVPTMITATQMVASGLFGGASTVTVTEDDASSTNHRITFVEAGASGADNALQVDTDSLTYNPVTDTLNIQTASLEYISGTAGSAHDTLNLVNSASIAGDVTIAGNLTVNGVQTIVNSTEIQLDDLNILLANGVGDDAAVNGGGITLDSSDGDKTFQFEATGDNWGSSENLNLASGKTLKIANTEVLSATALTIGAAAMSEADLEKLDDITNGAAAASKAVVLDASRNVKDINILGTSEISASVKDLNIRTGQQGSGNMIFHAVGGTQESHFGFIFSASTSDKGHMVLTGDSSNSAKLEFEAGGSIGAIQYNGSSGLDVTAKNGNLQMIATNGTAQISSGFSGGKVKATSEKVQLDTPSGTGRVIEFHNNGFKAGEIEVYTDSGNAAKFEIKSAATAGVQLSASAGALTLSGSNGIRIDGTGVADTTVAASDKLYFRDSDGLMKTDAVSDVLELAFDARVVEKVFYDGVGGGNTGAANRMSSNLLTASLDVGTDGNIISGSLQVFLNGMLQHLSSAAGVTPPANSAGEFIFDYRTSGSAPGTRGHIDGDGFTDTLPSAICLDSALDADDVLTVRYLKK